MTNVVGDAADAGATTAAPSAAASAEPPRPPKPDPQAIAGHVAAGGSPFDLVERPNWFSYSSFDTFERCPRQYAFRYLCRLTTEQARPAADFGTAAHGAFEAFTRERRERQARGEQPPTRADLDLYFEAAWAKSPLSADADAETWRRHAEPMLDRFWAAELAAEPETVGEEVRFRLELPLDPDAAPDADPGTPPIVTGYIDRIDRLPSGAVELIDYKSSPATSPQQAERSLQLSIYALACRDALDLGRPERVTLYCVDESRRCTGERTDAALDALRTDLAARTRAIRGSDFAPTPSPRSCGWCDFTGLCPVSER
jgi:putative RecB family exonuclease